MQSAYICIRKYVLHWQAAMPFVFVVLRNHDYGHAYQLARPPTCADNIAVIYHLLVLERS